MGRPGWLRWRRRELRRFGGATGALVAIFAGPIVGVTYLVWNWPQHGSDQLALVGVVSTVVAVWLAAVAAVVALLAYLVADESPDLSVALNGQPPASGLDIILGKHLGQGRHEILNPPEVVFRLENSSSYSARSPIIAVAFTDAFLYGLDQRWEEFHRTGDDISYQWAGGVNITVHGKGRILAPRLGLHDHTANWARIDMTMSVEVFAEGFHLSPQRVPIRVQLAAQ